MIAYSALTAHEDEHSICVLVPALRQGGCFVLDPDSNGRATACVRHLKKVLADNKFATRGEMR
jgi:hypothetical protein